MPAGDAVAGAEAAEEVFPAEPVQVEAAEGEERVVGVVLDAEGVLGDGVVGHEAVVVGAAEGGEEAVGDGEEGHVGDVRVVFGVVGDEMVDVVVALPPAEAEAAEEVGDDDPDDGVGREAVRDAHVSGVVRGEDELVPEQAEEEAAAAVPASFEAEEAQAEEEAVPG